VGNLAEPVFTRSAAYEHIVADTIAMVAVSELAGRVGSVMIIR
jgi:arginine/lysine/ornithine decarboxylase